VRAHFTYRPLHGNRQDIRDKVFVGALAARPGGLITVTCRHPVLLSLPEKPRHGAQPRTNFAGIAPAFDPRLVPGEEGGRP
jgi:hypothetical protein